MELIFFFRIVKGKVRINDVISDCDNIFFKTAKRSPTTHVFQEIHLK